MLVAVSRNGGGHAALYGVGSEIRPQTFPSKFATMRGDAARRNPVLPLPCDSLRSSLRILQSRIPALGRRSRNHCRRCDLGGAYHVPAVRTIGSTTIVNPGSLGQPKTGSPEGRYAVWEDGKIKLKAFPYAVEAAVSKLQALPIACGLRDELSTILWTGQVPPSKALKGA